MTKYEIHRIYHTVSPKREGPRQGNESIMLAKKMLPNLKDPLDNYLYIVT